MGLRLLHSGAAREAFASCSARDALSLRWAGPGRKPWGKRQSPATVLLCDPRKGLPVWASSPVRWRSLVRCGKGLSWNSPLNFDTFRCEISGIVDEMEKQSHKTLRSKAS